MTKSQMQRASRVADLGCLICGDEAMIHHALTGAGGRRNHDLILPLCHRHHQGNEGIHTLGRKAWERRFGTERELLERVKQELGE